MPASVRIEARERSGILKDEWRPWLSLVQSAGEDGDPLTAVVTGTNGNDTLVGTDGDDVIDGLDGDDVIDGRLGADVLNGGGGDDIFLFTSVISTNVTLPIGRIDGGLGIDTLDLSRVAPVRAFDTAETIRLQVGSQRWDVVSIERIVSGSGDDFFNFGGLAQRLDISSGAGNDTITASGVGSVVSTGDGDDHVSATGPSRGSSAFTIYLGAGNDRAFVGPSDMVYGEAGDDTISISSGAFSAAPRHGVIDGGAGQDTLAAQDGFVVDLTAGTATLGSTSFSLVSIEHVTASVSFGIDAQVRGDSDDNVIRASGLIFPSGRATFHGGDGNDTLHGASGDDVLHGDAGDDSIFGGVGNDRIEGGAGDDLLVGGSGDDMIDGGDGFDTASYEDAPNGVSIQLGSLFGPILPGIGNGQGSDRLTSIERVVGSAFNDVIQGNRLVGSTLEGRDGDDRLFGLQVDDRLIGGAGDDHIDGGSGFDTAVFAARYADVMIEYDAFGGIIVTGPDGRDNLTNIELLEFADGQVDIVDGRVVSDLRQNLVGGDGSDNLVGGASRDSLSGGAGDDTLRGGGNDDRLDGGIGYDVAVYAGGRRQYGADSASVRGGPEGGTDTLTGIEALEFIDGTLTFDVSSQAAQLMRLYSAALDREPDQGGFEALLDNLERGESIRSMANAFLLSPEFQVRFGGLSNADFIAQLYRFSLGREPDAGGLAFWTGELDRGVSRSDMLLTFSESQEHRGQTAGTLARGLWIADEQALIVARLYDSTFDRLPDPGGLVAWVTQLEGGMTLSSLGATFAGSQEFQARYGNLSNEQYVAQLYRFTLNREADAGGLAFWTGELNRGVSRGDMLLAFSESAEHIGLTRAAWLGGVRFEGLPETPQFAVEAQADAEAKPSADGPQVLIDEAVYDPADLGLRPDEADAFVLPALGDDIRVPAIEEAWWADPEPRSEPVNLVRLHAERDVAFEIAAADLSADDLHPHANDWL